LFNTSRPRKLHLQDSTPLSYTTCVILIHSESPQKASCKRGTTNEIELKVVKTRASESCWCCDGVVLSATRS